MFLNTFCISVADLGVDRGLGVDGGLDVDVSWRPCQPVRNNIATPRHMFFLFFFSLLPLPPHLLPFFPLLVFPSTPSCSCLLLPSLQFLLQICLFEGKLEKRLDAFVQRITRHYDESEKKGAKTEN